MTSSTVLEPFPQFVPLGHQYVCPEPARSQQYAGQLKSRRASSGLRGEPRGDANGSAMATGRETSNGQLNGAPRHPYSSERPRRSRRPRAKSFLKRWKTFSLRHTWVNPLIACLTIVTLYYSKPGASNPLHAALFPSYPLPRQPGDDPNAPLQYGKGGKDFAFVGFYVIFLTFTREFIMQCLLRPLAIRAGMKTKGKQSRFMEQAYTAIYFAVFGPLGLHIMSRTTIWYFDTNAYWAGHPNKTHDALFKSYYLIQASYWAQQAVVLLLQLEKPRKDFKELVAHHVIALTLIWLSYRFHFTYVGLAVYITHDVSDFFLATSKVLNYLESRLIVPYFCVFLASWAYLRHYLNLCIIMSILPLPSPLSDAANENVQSAINFATATFQQYGAAFFPAATNYIVQFYNKYPQAQVVNWTPNNPALFATVGPYEINWETQEYKSPLAQWIAIFLLGSLQSVNLFWFFLILRILWRMVISLGSEAKDERSEYSDEEVETEDRQTELTALRKEQGDYAALGVDGASLDMVKEQLNEVPDDRFTSSRAPTAVAS